jgi:spore maturation protein CgeB
MSGALYITHRNPDLTSLYKEGEEIEFYLTVDEAISKIRFYLQNPDELSRVAFNGQNKALKNYTWHNRLLGTFRRLGLIEDSYNT